MKKIVSSLFALGLMALTFSGCSDVPAPYEEPGNGSGGGGIEKVIFSEDFSKGQGQFKFIDIEKGSLSYVWKATSYNASYYLYASAFANNVANASESWCVSPAIDLSDCTKAVLNFEHAINKIGTGIPSEMMTVWASTDYTNDIKAATWTKLEVPAYPNGTSWSFIKSGEIDLQHFTGKKVYIGFKYTSTSEAAGVWEVTNFEIKGNGTPMENPGEDDDDDNEPEVPSGTNLLTNGGFETWTNGIPTGWKSTSTASSALLTQTNDSHSGSSAVNVEGTTSSNKRLATAEITLKAGTYTFTAYFKAGSTNMASYRMGYVPIVDGKAGTYVYEDSYHNDLSNSTWVQTSYNFTLAEQTTVCLIVMNPKSTGTALLVDDATLTTENGGLAEGGDGEEGDDETTKVTFTKVTTITSGSKYILTAAEGATFKMAKPLGESYTYGYLYVGDISVNNNNLSTDENNAFTLTATTGGYTIRDTYGKYLYMAGTYNNFNASKELPAEGHIWTITPNADGTFKITNTLMNKFVQYSSAFTSFGAYSDATGTQPVLFVKN